MKIPHLLIPLLVIAGVGMSELIPHLWYPKVNAQDGRMLHLREYDRSPDIEVVSLSENRTGELLSFDRGKSYDISYLDDDEEKSLTVIAMEYDPGNGRLWRDFFGHSPDICMPSSGALLTEGPMIPSFEKSFPNCKIQRYQFSHPTEKGPLFVYKLVWLGFDDWQSGDIPDFDRWGMRVEVVMSRNSIPPGSLILALVKGYEKTADADRVFESFVLANCFLKE